MDASTSVYDDEEGNDVHVHTTKSIQAGGPGNNGNFEAIRDAWGVSNVIVYPDTRRNEDIVDTFFEKEIPDPYRWLENPDSEETQTFIDEQNHLTELYVEKASGRDAIRAKLTEMWDFKKTECPKKFGSRYFYLENSGLQNQPMLYVKDNLDEPARVLVEPNELSVEGLVSISSYSVSPNGDYIAYSLSENGSDWSSIYIKNAASGQNFLEVLNFSKMTAISWTSDNRGFFYPRFPKPKSGKMNGTDFSENLKQKLYYHRIGSRQDDDIMMVEFPENPTWAISCTVTLDGRYLLISAGDEMKHEHTFYMDIGWKGAITRDIAMISLFPQPGHHQYLANDELSFTFLTNEDASNYRIVRFQLTKSKSQEEWENIVEESPTAVISWARVVAGDKLAICYNEHLDMRLQIHKLSDGEIVKALVFDDSISSWDHYGRRDLNEMFVRVESYLNPGVLYRLRFDDDKEVESEMFDKIEIPYYDPGLFTTELVFYSNDDGTNIPMTIIYRNSTMLDGNAPCILYSYGGFGKSLLPEFNVPFVLFAQNMDGVVAVANIRGGGEYGTDWWEEGKLSNKVNAVEDIIAAANFLINNKYTRASKLTLMGRSNGGTTVAATINKRPELFGSAICDMGIMDLLRFRNFTLGHLWVGEYGNVDNQDELQHILSYSPLHNITAPTSNSPQYPAVFVTTSDHDDRVVPFHSYKYIAELQHTVGQTMNQSNPFMLHVYQNIGHHGKGIPSMKAIEKATDDLCFLENSLGYEFHF